MNLSALHALACPSCGDGLKHWPERVLGCAIGHRFDVARQGYVALLGPRARTDTGDSAAMVVARVRFLAGGFFSPIAAAAAEAVDDSSDLVVETGAGTGYYLSTVLDARSKAAGIALDASKYAARRAAGDPRVISVVADAWSRWPIRSGAAGAVLSVFAPRNVSEVVRVLAPAGRFVAVTPKPGHLAAIRGPLGMLAVDAGKAERLAESLRGRFDVVAARGVAYPVELNRADVAAVVAMGPAARHRSADEIATAVATLPDSVTDRVDVTLSVFQLR